ncbi:type I site-specific restriction-modification system R (restriction) subunit [Haloferula luteola]|uniref:Type I site-specific restriction-modification system R (Restriction) subunit n=1 Tax=Haloferula luteola TaxID=595692 RepID=A0A840VAM8_9BACT|nr:type I restriction endonuclease [Haloferula luteola]MBB5349961.1 type I site-specific restriction-modification system R (restriction) subunit [Haloferula luteola]
MPFSESTVEEAALEWFGELGYAIGHGPEMAPGEAAAERESFAVVVLEVRLREALRRLNPEVPEEALEEVLRRVLRVADGTLVRKPVNGEFGMVGFFHFPETAG